MSGYTPQYEIEIETISIMTINGLAQGCEGIDARESASLRSQRLADFFTEQEHFCVSNDIITSSIRRMEQQIKDFDTSMARSELSNHKRAYYPDSQRLQSTEAHAPLATSGYSSVDRQDSVENQPDLDIDKGRMEDRETVIERIPNQSYVSQREREERAAPRYVQSNVVTPSAPPMVRELARINNKTHVSTANVTLSPTNTPRTPSSDTSKSNDIFTDQDEPMDSQTDTDRDVVDSEDESTAVSTEDEAKIMIMQTLGSCVFSACSHDLTFAATLIPQIHSLVYGWTYSDNGNYTTAVGTSSGRDSSNSRGGSSSTPSGISGTSTSGKRARKSDKGESSGRSERRRKVSINLEPQQNSPPRALPTFACHFHSNCPKKYNFQHGLKYKNCPHPSVPHNDLRRIKDHFQNHRLSQCDRCYVIFPDSRALVEHHQMPTSCEKGDSAEKEGIDGGQWYDIEKVLKKKTQKGRSDVEKWYDIWKILFPNTPPPRTPWNEPDTLSTSPSPDFETFMSSIISNVEARIEQGLLPRDDHLYRELYNIIRNTHQSQNGDSASRIPMVANSESVLWRGSNAESERGLNLENRTINRIDERADPAAPATPQILVAQFTHANNINLSEVATSLGLSPHEASNLQSNAPVPNFFPPEGWTESPTATFLPLDLHPQSSNFEHMAPNAPSPSNDPIIDTEHDNSGSNNLIDQFDFDAFLAQ